MAYYGVEWEVGLVEEDGRPIGTYRSFRSRSFRDFWVEGDANRETVMESDPELQRMLASGLVHEA